MLERWKYWKTAKEAKSNKKAENTSKTENVEIVENTKKRQNRKNRQIRQNSKIRQNMFNWGSALCTCEGGQAGSRHRQHIMRVDRGQSGDKRTQLQQLTGMKRDIGE